MTPERKGENNYKKLISYLGASVPWRFRVEFSAFIEIKVGSHAREIPILSPDFIKKLSGQRMETVASQETWRRETSFFSRCCRCGQSTTPAAFP